LLLLSFLTLTPSIAPVNAQQPVPDGAASVLLTNYPPDMDRTSVSLVLSTTRSHDLIVIAGLLEGKATIASVIDTNGLKYAERVYQSLPGGTLFEWYAVSSAPLSSDIITVNWVTNPPLDFGSLSGLVITAYAINGVNVDRPFESRPYVASAAGTSITGLFSAKKGQTILLMNAFCSSDCRGTPTQPANFTRIRVEGEYLYCVVDKPCPGSHLVFPLEDISYRVVSGSKSSYTAIESGSTMVDGGHGLTWNVLAESLRATG
jgi:hypothetical protein